MKDRNLGRRSASSVRMQCWKIREVYILYACRISVDCHADQMKVDYDAFFFHHETDLLEFWERRLTS